MYFKSLFAKFFIQKGLNICEAKMAIAWFIIVILIVLALIVIFKFQDVLFVFTLIKKYMFPIIFLVVVLFFVISLNYIHNSYGIDLTSAKGFVEALKVYLLWIKNLALNLGNVAGNAIKQDWAFGNVTK